MALPLAFVLLRRIFTMHSLSRTTKHDQTSRHRRTWSAKTSTSPDIDNHWMCYRRNDDPQAVDSYLAPVIGDGKRVVARGVWSHCVRSCGMIPADPCGIGAGARTEPFDVMAAP